jgi:hypothetical protein
LLTAGDSLAGQLPAPKKYTRALKRWLESQFDGKWIDKQNSLPIGKQFDGNSCAICAMNAIAHAVFGDQLWEQKRASIARAEWFTTLVESHVNDVSVNFFKY